MRTIQTSGPKLCNRSSHHVLHPGCRTSSQKQLHGCSKPWRTAADFEVPLEDLRQEQRALRLLRHQGPSPAGRRPAAGRPPTVGGVERTALEGGSGRFGKLAGEWFLLGLGLGLNGREYGAIKECARIAPKEDSQSKEATPTILMFEHFTLFF